MKNRIDVCFEQLKRENKKALITFVTAGDPDLETTEKCVYSMFENGADIVELGVPFSDPIAEGPTIQKASLRALEKGTTLDMIFGTVKKIRKNCDKPLLLMMYVNTIFRYGTEKFFSLCSECGIDGVIVPDLPFEERDEITPYADKYGVYSINLVAPTSHERIKMIAGESKGFLYVVSSLGVTGKRSEFTTDFSQLLAPLKDSGINCPACIGFGISNPQQAAKMSSYCDGVIVGSAVVDIIAEYGKNAPEKTGELIRSLKSEM
ncbi:tryptophan synthase subunit alpha [Ruminococcus sp. Marseille-P6503]|uniref:tryptophan synthase subunit alpha n=1 Tax=Ruminococcus sp. Marseille-P6503 TaxID=2364796 RepID=UPI000F527920|nr:tryptophan synthase subunit alpha [Ruminococcus sp. Marseille-P6503]